MRLTQHALSSEWSVWMIRIVFGRNRSHIQDRDEVRVSMHQRH